MKKIINSVNFDKGKIIFKVKKPDKELEIINSIIEQDMPGIWLDPMINELPEKEVNSLDIALKKWLLNSPVAYSKFFDKRGYYFLLEEYQTKHSWENPSQKLLKDISLLRAKGLNNFEICAKLNIHSSALSKYYLPKLRLQNGIVGARK